MNSRINAQFSALAFFGYIAMHRLEVLVVGYAARNDGSEYFIVSGTKKVKSLPKKFGCDDDGLNKLSKNHWQAYARFWGIDLRSH